MAFLPRRLAYALLRALRYLVIAVAALLVALFVTPTVPVSTFGQTVRVGAVAPSLGLGWSGPGEADLFGEGAVATVQQFSGPIRPRIVWQRFNRNDAAAAFIQTGGPSIGSGTATVGRDLADGWVEYFVRLLIITALVGAGFYLALIGIYSVARTGRLSTLRRRPLLVGLALSVAASVLLLCACAALTVASARSALAHVTSLADLTGRAHLVPLPAPVGPHRGDIDVAVIGDSTAAGVGNADLPNPSREDTACGRSADAYAEVLGHATGLSVLNLACSSATLADGLLGPQTWNGVTMPPQVGVLKSIRSLRVVIVSAGANDVGWSDFLRYCYALVRCDDQASSRLFQRRLDSFRLQYAQLLQQLGDLPSHPAVIVVKYYDPFGDTFDCPALQDPNAPADPPKGFGFGPDPGQDDQAQKIAEKIDPLRSELAQLNDVLAQGAQAFGFTTVQPDFSGHALCAAQSWVQGLSARYPFHPDAAGELAIAAALLPHVATLVK